MINGEIGSKKNSKRKNNFKKNLEVSMVAIFCAAGLMIGDANALVTPDGVSPSSVIDKNNTRPYWVGLGMRNATGTSGGACTGLLINPRTVLFAAHCVDGYYPWVYGSQSTPNRAAVGYTTDPNFGTNNLIDWMFYGGDDLMTNSTFVWWDPRSRNGFDGDWADGSFLPADIALAGFDTPTDILGRDGMNGIGLLFSQVNGLVPVTIGGYGQYGNGLTGARSGWNNNDQFMRRLGKNMLGFFGTDRDVNIGVYGEDVADFLSQGVRFQDMYWVDFDNPNRATQPFSANINRDPSKNTFDFDIFAGAAINGESLTAPGDSGSPLVTDAYGREVSLGVLSSGTRFFFDRAGDPNDNNYIGGTFSNYGSISGYNPLFLFWDQIVVNNPYKYVGAVAGNGEWTDPTHWVQELDPLYYTLSGNTLVNALPTTAPIGSNSTAPNIGSVTPSPSPIQFCAIYQDCEMAANNDVSVSLNTLAQTSRRIGSLNAFGAVQGPMDIISQEAANSSANLTISQTSAQATALPTAGGALDTTVPADPDGTLYWFDGRIKIGSGPLTGPGSTGFVPDNVIGDTSYQNSTRWFEVNLRNAGTTFLTNADIFIDRLNIRGASSVLNIRAGASLGTELSSFVDNGNLHVDGDFYADALYVNGGRVTGNGALWSDNGTYILGGILSPGTVGTVGTMTNYGGIGFAQAGLFGVDVTSNTSADKLNVFGNLVLGGGFAANFANNYVPAWGTSWTIASVSNLTLGNAAFSMQPEATNASISGSFSALSSNLPGLLRPNVTVSGNNLLLEITALPMQSFANCVTNECRSFAVSLSNSRSGNYNSLKPLYQTLDVMSAGGLGSVLDSMTPSDHNILSADLLMGTNLFSNLVLDRLSSRVAGLDNMPGLSANLKSFGMSGISSTKSSFNLNAAEGAMNETVPLGTSFFGELRSVKGTLDANHVASGSDSDGWAAIFGIDKVTPSNIMGIAVQSSSTKGKTNNSASTADAKSTVVTAYGGLRGAVGMLQAYATLGKGDYEMTRQSGPYSMRGDTKGSIASFGIEGVTSKEVKSGKFVSSVGVSFDKITIDGYNETGTAALHFDDREIKSSIGRVGSTFYPKVKEGGLQPWLNLTAAYAFNAEDYSVDSFGFAAAPGVIVDLSSADKTDNSWFEAGLGFTGKVGKADLGLAYESTIGRDDIKIQTISAKYRITF